MLYRILLVTYRLVGLLVGLLVAKQTNKQTNKQTRLQLVGLGTVTGFRTARTNPILSYLTGFAGSTNLFSKNGTRVFILVNVSPDYIQNNKADISQKF